MTTNFEFRHVQHISRRRTSFLLYDTCLMFMCYRRISKKNVQTNFLCLSKFLYYSILVFKLCFFNFTVKRVKFIAGNNDTDDNISLVSLSPVKIWNGPNRILRGHGETENSWKILKSKISCSDNQLKNRNARSWLRESNRKMEKYIFTLYIYVSLDGRKLFKRNSKVVLCRFADIRLRKLTLTISV